MISKKRPYNVNFHGKATSKWPTDPLRERHVTYPSLPVDDFAYRPQIIFKGVGQQHFPFCSQKDNRLTLPWMKYFEILTHHYVWSRKEFEEFPTSFASSKTSYFIRLLGILTSDTGILCSLFEVSCPILNLIVLRPSDFALKRHRN